MTLTIWGKSSHSDTVEANGYDAACRVGYAIDGTGGSEGREGSSHCRRDQNPFIIIGGEPIPVS